MISMWDIHRRHYRPDSRRARHDQPLDATLACRPSSACAWARRSGAGIRRGCILPA